MPLEDRQRVVAIVAKAVIQCKDGERLSPFRFGECRRNFVQPDEAVATHGKRADSGIQKVGRDLEMSIGLEGAAVSWSDMMQGEDDAAAPQMRRQTEPRQDERGLQSARYDRSLYPLLQLSRHCPA